MVNGLSTLSECAITHGTTINVISGLVKLLGIKTKPMPLNGIARGLDAADLAAINAALDAGRRALRRPA